MITMIITIITFNTDDDDNKDEFADGDSCCGYDPDDDDDDNYDIEDEIIKRVLNIQPSSHPTFNLIT